VTLSTDKKVVNYALLTYLVYGLTYIFILRGFVVPLPMIYVIVPCIAIFFFFRTIKSWFSLLFLLLPLVVMKDLLFEWPQKWVELITLIGFISWSLTGGLVYRTFPSQISFKTTAILLIFTPILLVPFLIDVSEIWFVALALLSFFSIQRTADHSPDQPNPTVAYRLILFIYLMTGLYALTLLSKLLNS
jgi:hypothetical protein